MRRGHRVGIGAAALAVVAGLVATPVAAAGGPACERVVMYSREGCPHCAEARGFLAELQTRTPGLRVEVRDVAQDPAALAALRDLSRRHGVQAPGVPAADGCGVFRVGFRGADRTGRELEALVRGGAPPAAAADAVEAPWVGRVSASELGLPLFTVVLGLVDGFNPCAIWVLLFLLSVLVNVRDRTRVVVVAGTFVTVSGLAYFAFMAAWLNVFLWVGFARWTQVALGILALAIGAVHVKDFFALGRGPSLSIPDAAKPGLYARMRRIVNAESLPAALGGAIVLAVLVNVVELLCTAGIPAVYTRVLTLQDLSPAGYYGYLALYNLAYVFDDSLLVAAVVVTMRRRKLQEGQGRWLKLLSGVVILALGACLLVAPQILTL